MTGASAFSASFQADAFTMIETPAEVTMDLKEVTPGLVIAALGFLAWAATLSFGWLAPASVVDGADRTVIGLSTCFMVVTLVGAIVAVIGFLP